MGTDVGLRFKTAGPAASVENIFVDGVDMTDIAGEEPFSSTCTTPPRTHSLLGENTAVMVAEPLNTRS
jgi:DNA sulfur modification protein DndE